MRASLQFNHRQVRDENGLTFKTPEPWLGGIGVLRSYKGLTFNRALAGDEITGMMGVGHKAFDAVLEQARGLEASVTVLTSAQPRPPLLIYRVFDRVTARPAGERSAFVGVRYGDAPELLRDWELLRETAELYGKSGRESIGLPLVLAAEEGERFVRTHLPGLGLGFVKPQLEFFGGIWFQSV